MWTVLLLGFIMDYNNYYMYIIYITVSQGILSCLTSSKSTTIYNYIIIINYTMIMTVYNY